jgi:hypothetical protein
VPWEKVLQLLVVSQLLDPGSEFRVHQQWYLTTAMDALLGTDFAVAEKNRLYRCLDRVLEHKQELFLWLRQKWADLFQAEFEVLLYDLTSTYFEGQMEENPKAKYGHSSDRLCLSKIPIYVRRWELCFFFGLSPDAHFSCDTPCHSLFHVAFARCS